MDHHPQFLRDHGWFSGMRRKSVHTEIEDKSKGDAISKGCKPVGLRRRQGPYNTLQDFQLPQPRFQLRFQILGSTVFNWPFVPNESS